MTAGWSATRHDGPAVMVGTRPSLREVLAALCRDWWKLAIAFALTLGAAAGAAMLLTPKYMAQASLYVKFGREYTYRAETGGSEVVAPTFDREQVIRAEVQILLAPDLADEVVKKVGLARLYPGIASGGPSRVPAADQGRVAFLANLDATGGTEGNVISVTFRHPDGRVASDALNALVEAYIAKRRPLFAEARAGALEAEAATAERRLATAEDALARFRLDRGIVDFPAQRELLLQQTGALDRDLQAVRNELAGFGERVSALRGRLENTPPTIVLHSETQRSPALAEGKKVLLDLRVRESELAAEYLPTSKPMRDVRRSIEQVESTLADLERQRDSAVRSGPNPVHAAIQTQLATAEAELGAASARHATITRQLDEVNARLGRLAADERELDSLARERRLAVTHFEGLSQKLDEARVLDKVALTDSANVRVLQTARVPPFPKDQRVLVLALGFVAAVVAVLLTAFVCDLTRSGFLTPEQLERSTGLPVLASVPLAPQAALAVRRR